MDSLDPIVIRHLQTRKLDERIEDLNNQIWIRDEHLGYRQVTVIDEGLSDILVGFRDEQGFFEKKRIDKKDCEVPSLNNYSDDLCTLTQPNAATVLHALKIRYTSNVIHTYCGLFCVVINPWKSIPIYSSAVKQVYQHGCDLPPHVYSVAQNAYHGILNGGKNQSILITGESGAGKTENTKKIIDFILDGSGSSGSTIGECVVTSGVLLEALGNARTVHNSNSSRFGKFIRIEFDEDSKLIGARIECYLLEKSRVVAHNDGDRNFHIFYQMLSDHFVASHKSFLKLSKKPEEFKFLHTTVTDPSIKDSEAARLTDEAFNRLGFSQEEKIWVFQILSAILWIGDIKFGERSGLDLSFVESMKEVDNIAELLEMKSSKLVDALTQPTIRVHDKLIRKNQNLGKTLNSASAMAKILYERLFAWIVQRCNDAFSMDSRTSNSSHSNRFIAVLDIAGFEIVEKNSFEQFCINYTNEKLQQFFNHFMFVKEQNNYLEEGIKWTQLNFANHLQPTIDLIEKPMGILSLLEEECVVPNGSEKSLVEKLCSTLANDENFSKSKQTQKCQTIRHFAVQHYAGQVHYNIDGWLDKNRDNVETSVLEVLSASTHPLLKMLFPPIANNNLKTRRGTITNSTVSFLYKNQLQNLLDTLNISSAHFIRCVVPNYEKIPGKIEASLVLSQLRCNGVLEGIRICREGYPCRMTHSEFIDRYSLLLQNKTEKSLGAREKCAQICADSAIRRERFAIGRTKVFGKVGVLSELEKKRTDRISEFVVGIQSRIRFYRTQRDFAERVARKNAILMIQNNVRKFCELSQWPWYRIHQLTRGLIPMDREKQKINELENENRELREEIQILEEKNEESLKENLQLTGLLEKVKNEKREVEFRIEEIERNSREKLLEKEREFRKTIEDMEQNEEIFNVLEKKYEDQHKKVMKMNDVLREYERKIDSFDMEKGDLEAENQKLKDAHLRNSALLDDLRKELNEKNGQVDDLQNQVQKLLDEGNEQKLIIAKLETELDDEKARQCRQNNTISELQKLVTELNEKIARFDNLILNEKNVTRRIEREKEKLSDEVQLAKEVIQKQAKKIDELKDECRTRGNEIRRLERKLEDKEAMMADCVKELKDSHKERMKELEQKVEDVKRKNSKLENENVTQKNQIEAFQRESSVDSDYGRSSSGRLSTIGRQYSLTSMSSFSSIRTIGLRRKDSESDMTSSMYSLRGRRDSIYDMSQSVTSSSALQRSPSTSQVMEKERRILELEKEKAAINTDLQLVKRELDVYKSQLSAVESEKESIQNTVRKQTSQLQETTRQLNSAQKNADNLALRLKKALGDCEEWKRKHENAIVESKNEILAERKRAMDRADASEKENELKHARIAIAEHAKTELNGELSRAQSELDRCRAIITQLEENLKSQTTLGTSFERHQSNLNFEIESLRDENCALKAKIRRQYKQIELLTQQDETNDELNHFQNKMDRFL